MDNEELIDHIVTMLFAGHDTSANTLCWALYYISKDPQVEARVRLHPSSFFSLLFFFSFFLF
jgi:cytochrome P450